MTKPGSGSGKTKNALIQRVFQAHADPESWLIERAGAAGRSGPCRAGHRPSIYRPGSLARSRPDQQGAAQSQHRPQQAEAQAQGAEQGPVETAQPPQHRRSVVLVGVMAWAAAASGAAPPAGFASPALTASRCTITRGRMSWSGLAPAGRRRRTASCMASAAWARSTSPYKLTRATALRPRRLAATFSFRSFDARHLGAHQAAQVLQGRQRHQHLAQGRAQAPRVRSQRRWLMLPHTAPTAPPASSAPAMPSSGGRRRHGPGRLPPGR